MKKNKKAQLSGLQAGIGGLIGLGLFVAIALFVMSTMSPTMKATETYSNDQITLLNETAVSLTYDEVQGISSEYNATDATQSMGSGNYSANLAAGTITLINNDYNNTAWNFTYSYLADTNASTALTTTSTAAGTVPSWITILIVALMGSVALFFILRAFGRQTR
jgi:hypothetical protein